MSITDWLRMMPDTIVHEPRTGTNAYAEPTYGAGVSRRARVTQKPTRLHDMRSGAPMGSVAENVAKGVVWVGPPVLDLTDATLATFTTDDRITLPDGTTPPILAWERIADESGGHHIKLYYGGA